jgi:hypothetical protein
MTADEAKATFQAAGSAAKDFSRRPAAGYPWRQETAPEAEPNAFLHVARKRRIPAGDLNAPPDKAFSSNRRRHGDRSILVFQHT